jgi:hypothetical protein
MTPHLQGTLTMALHRGQNPFFCLIKLYSTANIYTQLGTLSGKRKVAFPSLLFVIFWFIFSHTS